MIKSLLIASLLASASGTFLAPSSPRQQVSPQAAVYWGAWIAGGVYGREDAPWGRSTVAEFERHVGKRVSIIHFGQPWEWCNGSTCSFAPFMTDAMELTRRHRAIPMVTWGSWARERGVNQPDFRLANIAAGAFDNYIRSWALAAKGWGHPFFLRLDHEMNINCCWPWAVTQNGNRSADYVAMWRHVHDIFTSVGVTNATWVWCPNREYDGSARNLASFYPGDAYVDWTCLDGYNWGVGSSHDSSGWLSFNQLFGPTYRLVTRVIAPSKPMMIGETGSAEKGGSKARWLTTAFADLSTLYPRIRAFVWSNARWDNMDWQVESSASAERAFRAGIRSSRFAGNVFGELSGGTVRPLQQSAH
jgi:hypothetical protein